MCVDNLSTGFKKNIKHLLSSPDFTFIKQDITKSLPRSITSKSIKYIANLASPASPPAYQRLALETLSVGSNGTLNMLELARKKSARLLHASTSEVYGDPNLSPQPESYWGNVNSYGPRSMYDEAKRYSEALIYSYKQKYKVSTVIVRFFNTYGPKMDPKDGRVVSNFVVQALSAKPLTVYGNGKQTRSFCYVDDLIRGIVVAIDSKEEGPINLGNPNEFTVIDLAKKVIKKTGTKSKIKYMPLPKDDPMQRKPDITLAKKRLHWEPKIMLDEGLDKVIPYFDDLLSK